MDFYHYHIMNKKLFILILTQKVTECALNLCYKEIEKYLYSWYWLLLVFQFMYFLCPTTLAVSRAGPPVSACVSLV
jgi:hypothetical protein